jgi:predicted nucleic acid-binding protein
VLTIIDTSVALKWFIVDNEPKRTEALSVLENICVEPHCFAVPELFLNEMLAVFCRLLSKPSEIKEHMHALEQLGWERIGNGAQLLDKAAELATEFHISGYDAVFAASALLVDGIWLTADAVAAKKLRSRKFVRLL